MSIKIYCKKCKYNQCEYCTLTKAHVDMIRSTPCKIPNVLLNDAERYMRDKNRKFFFSYIREKVNMQLKKGDLLSVIDSTFLWHSNDDHPEYLKIVDIQENGNIDVVDPFYDVKFEAFSTHYQNRGFHTLLEPKDFKDTPNDRWVLSPKDFDTTFILIDYNQELENYIKSKGSEI